MRKPASQGFTLLELMIVISIVAIIASVGLANYTDSVRKSKRTEARATLTITSTSLAKCKAIYGVYNNANCSIQDGDVIDSADRNYTINVGTTATTFTLTALPTADSTQASDADCTSLMLDNLGVQTATGDNPLDCW